MNDILISRSVRGINSESITEWPVSLKSMLEYFWRNSKRVHQKDGAYFLRCDPLNLINEKREASLLIIEGNRRITSDGRVVSGAPNMDIVHSILLDLDVSHIIYTTYSHAMSKNELDEMKIDSGGMYEGNYNRYRILIHCQYTEDQLNFLIPYVINKFHQHGAMLVDEDMNREWARPWYTHRTPEHRHYKSKQYHYVGNPLDICKAITEVETTHFLDGDFSDEQVKILNSVGTNVLKNSIWSWIQSHDHASDQIRFTISDLLTEALGKTLPHLRRDEMEAAKALRSLGFSKRRQSVKGELKVVWSRKQR